AYSLRIKDSLNLMFIHTLESQMDPIRALLEALQDILRETLPDQAVAAEMFTKIEGVSHELFSHFELVPKHTYEAHVAILTSLQTQVATLEQRLVKMEETGNQ
ncbi:MAG: hypothetical protein L7T19_11130, partial [Pseudomonadales bacterium]|nr:hypothetical protein [Pseudomonadales bacterium]